MAAGGSERLLRAVERCGFRGVDQAWVDTVWELEFTETEPLDPRQEALITDDGLDAFVQLYKALHPFADPEAPESIWTLFAEHNISHNAIIAVLYHFVQEALSKKANLLQRLYGFNAAGLYFMLLEIPGSIVNQVFHPVMFEKCLQTLAKCWPQQSDLARKRKKDNKSCKGSRKKMGRSPRKENTPMDKAFEEEEDQEEKIYFSAHELLQIRETLFDLLKNLLRLLSKFSLKERPHCVQTCIQIFVNLMSFEPCVREFEPLETKTIDRAKYVPQLAYFGLQLLCSPLHSSEDKILRRVFQRLLSVILMLSGTEASHGVATTLPSQVTGARSLAIKLISSLTEELKEVAFPVLRILLQHICVKVPDKSEYRTFAALSLTQLLYKLPCAEHASFIAWLYKYSCNSKTSYRVFALDVALALLALPEREQDVSLSEDQQQLLKHKFLVQEMIFGRCSDKAPTVRSKALSSFAQCLETKASSNMENILELMQGIAGSVIQDSNMPTGTFLTQMTGVSSHRTKTFPMFKTFEVTGECNTTELNGKEIMAMLRLRAGDEKTNVRKSALQVLMSILKYQMVSCSEEDLATLQDRCRDPAVSVRKQALQSITDLLMSQSSNVLIQKAWLTGVIPVVMDVENSVQEKALDCLYQLLLQPIKHCRKFTNQDKSQVLAWDLLTLFTEESQDLSRYLNKAFHIWSKQNKFSSTFVSNIISYTETEHAAPAWLLLAKVASSAPKLDYSKIIDAWDSIRRQHDASIQTMLHILCVIGSVAKHLSSNIQGRLMDDIKGWLLDFQCPLEAIGPAVETLQKLSTASTDDPKEVQDMLNGICGELVSTCEHFISGIVLQEYGTEQLQEDLLVRYLFTLGEAAQLCPTKVEKRVFLLIQSILASPESVDQSSSPADSEDVPSFQPLSQFRGSVMPSVIRAHAFITLGKLCLQHEDLAKKCIGALARELEVSKDVAVRNNVVIVMCDLCIRYTTMVDRYIPNISTCLKDPEPFIRKQTLILLTNLLQEEFVKWKGSLFFRFVSVLVDPNQEIASLAKFCLVHLLLKRNPVMFSQHFIECIFHFNCYERHEKYNRFTQSEREKNLFSLKGKANKEKRMEIYKFLLEHFTDEQRFSITSKISLNVLACFVDGVLPLDMEASELLSDTFEILSCKEIKLAATRARPEDDIEADEDERAMANAVMQVAQKKLISQVQKKNFIENVIPVITSLKTSLEQSRLPALRDLMNYLREMMQDYRTEIKEFFVTDKQLAAELEYDMRRYEEQLERESELGQEVPVDGEVLRPPTAAQSPTSKGAALPADPQDKAASPATRRERSPLRTRPASFAGFATPERGVLRIRPRNMSMNTLAILNSAKKAVETAGKQRSRSLGQAPILGGGRQSSKTSFGSLSQASCGANIALEGRAISTPEKSISNVTFGAGVSYISVMRTPGSAQESKEAQDEEKQILCLPSLDEPLPQPQPWKINSPKKGHGPPSIELRRSSQRKAQQPRK